MEWYHVSQNNSGGNFKKVTSDALNGIFATWGSFYKRKFWRYKKPDYLVLAASPEEAIQKLLDFKYGEFYLNGVKNRIDCNCCGNRWENRTDNSFESLKDAVLYFRRCLK